MDMPGNTPAHHLPQGTVLNNKYRIEHTLGEGGFGITYKGTDTMLDMPVAIKEYFPNGFANRFSPVSFSVTLIEGERASFFSKWKEKFLMEARTLARLDDIRGIVNVRDFFEENGTAYIVMEFLKGSTLKYHVENNGVIPAQRMISMMIPLLNSLNKVHEQGLIHRDISPDNIMLMPDGRLKLYDFGAARDFSMQSQRSLSVMLKPGYAPQEQYRSRGKQGPWTDVYAICATIYFCITGIVPDDSMQRVFEDEVKRPSELGVDISPYIEDVILKGMSIKESERYQTVLELADALAKKSSKSTVVKISSPTKKDSGSEVEMSHTVVMLSGEKPAPADNRTSVMPSSDKPAPADNRTSVMPSSDKHAPADNRTSVMPSSDKPAPADNRTSVMPSGEKPAPAATTWECSRCLTENDNSTEYCSGCGYDKRGRSRNVETENKITITEKKDKKPLKCKDSSKVNRELKKRVSASQAKTMLIFGIIVAVLCVGMFIVSSVVNNGTTPAENKTSSSSAVSGKPYAGRYELKYVIRNGVQYLARGYEGSYSHILELKDDGTAKYSISAGAYSGTWKLQNSRIIVELELYGTKQYKYENGTLTQAGANDRMVFVKKTDIL